MSGLSGFGDLALTCTSDMSRNYRFGLSLGRGDTFDPGITVEGAKTAVALEKLSRDMGIDLPICATVNKLVHHQQTVADALQHLMSRPLKEE
jgi:glycerol-3-phosphate dehydrogenase (NAD(P)+)